MRLKNVILFLPWLGSSLLLAQSGDLSTTVLKLTQQIRAAVDQDDLPKALDFYVELGQSIQAEIDKGQPAPVQKLNQLEAEHGRKSEKERFPTLLELPRAAYSAGEYYKAEQYAALLLDSAKRFRNSPFYGGAIMEANTIKGRVLLQRNDVTGAKAALAASIGAASESPMMRIYGPKTDLAQDLLDAGEREAVIQFLSSCKPYWTLHQEGRLDLWIAAIRGGAKPELKR